MVVILIQVVAYVVVAALLADVHSSLAYAFIVYIGIGAFQEIYSDYYREKMMKEEYEEFAKFYKKDDDDDNEDDFY